MVTLQTSAQPISSGAVGLKCNLEVGELEVFSLRVLTEAMEDEDLVNF